jgi:hypothetical protein
LHQHHLAHGGHQAVFVFSGRCRRRIRHTSNIGWPTATGLPDFAKNSTTFGVAGSAARQVLDSVSVCHFGGASSLSRLAAIPASRTRRAKAKRRRLVSSLAPPNGPLPVRDFHAKPFCSFIANATRPF